jgi:hypothetical protein
MPISASTKTTTSRLLAVAAIAFSGMFLAAAVADRGPAATSRGVVCVEMDVAGNGQAGAYCFDAQAALPGFPVAAD